MNRIKRMMGIVANLGDEAKYVSFEPVGNRDPYFTKGFLASNKWAFLRDNGDIHPDLSDPNLLRYALWSEYEHGCVFNYYRPRPYKGGYELLRDGLVVGLIYKGFLMDESRAYVYSGHTHSAPSTNKYAGSGADFAPRSIKPTKARRR